MKITLLCSTGTLVGRANGYDHTLVVRRAREIEADGFELMFVAAFYDKHCRIIAPTVPESGIVVQDVLVCLNKVPYGEDTAQCFKCGVHVFNGECYPRCCCPKCPGH